MSTSVTHVRPAEGALLSVGELSAHTDVSPRSLRYYEEQGLLSARRTAAGHRRYDHAAVARVGLVQRLFAAGLTSTEIGPLLPGLVDEEHRTEDLVSALREHRARLQREIARQLDTIDILDEVIEYHEQI